MGEISEKTSMKYILSLKAKTRRAQFREIMSQAEFLYPEKFTGEQLYFARYSNTQTILYITREKQKEKKLISPSLYEKNHKRAYSQNIKGTKRKDFVYQYRKRDYIIRAVLILLLVIIFVISYLVFTGELERINRARDARAALQSQEAKRMAAEKRELIKRAEVLEKEYNTLLSKEKRNIWDSITILLSAMDADASVDEMNITDNSFSLFIRSDNALGILSSLEKNPHIKEVSLEKLSLEGISESAMLRGVFSDLKTEYTLPDNPMDKIDYLEEKIREANKKNDDGKWESASAFLSELKSSLESSGCSIKSFVSRNTENSVVADVSAESSISSIFSFLEERNDTFSIQSLRIRRRSASVQTDVKATGEFRKTEKSQEDESPVTGDVATLFLDEEQDDVVKEETTVRKTNQFSFVGRARKDGVAYCMFKDERSGKIHRLILSDNSEISGSCTMTDKGGYLINIDNEKYEVGR